MVKQIPANVHSDDTWTLSKGDIICKPNLQLKWIDSERSVKSKVILFQPSY